MGQGLGLCPKLSLNAYPLPLKRDQQNLPLTASQTNSSASFGHFVSPSSISFSLLLRVKQVKSSPPEPYPLHSTSLFSIPLYEFKPSPTYKTTFCLASSTSPPKFNPLLFSLYSLYFSLMTRTLRILNSVDHTTVAAAPPPEAVAMESDFVVILAALLCALICVVGLIAVARCAWLRRGSGAGGSPTRALANKGLKKKVLQSLPRFTYVDGNPNKWVATSECAICLAEFADGDEIRVLPQCGHGFHMACIDTWLGSHSSCPSCRQILAVARCQKCGQYPAVGGGSSASAGATSGSVSEPELKSREDDNAVSSAAANSNINGGFNYFLP